MAIDPKKNVGKRIPAFPYDQNNKPSSLLMLPIVVSNEITGYLPAKAIDNGDGTATLDVSGGGGGGVDPVGLKNIAAAPINPATEDTLLLINTSIGSTNTKLDTLNAKDFATETTLATRATEATLATRASESTLATRATEATLATRATEATLAAIKAKTDQLTFVSTDLKVVDSSGGGGADALGKRLKHYNITKNIADSPVTLTVKADMDTIYSATDSKVRDVFFTKPSQDINVKFTTVDGVSEDIFIAKNEVFSLSDFEFTTLAITISVDNTILRILAEGV